MKINELMEKYFKDAIESDPKIIDEINVIIEAKVSEEVTEKLALKEKELDESNEKEMKEFKEAVVEKIDEYIGLSVEEFVEENKAGIESDIKVALAEKTFSTIKTLFTEASVEIPDGETDVVKELESKVEKMTKKLNEAVNNDLNSKKQIFEYEKSIKFVGISKDLSETAKEKLLTLLENVTCENLDDYEKKAIILKETVTEKKEDKKEEKLEEKDDGFEVSDMDKYLP